MKKSFLLKSPSNVAIYILFFFIIMLIFGHSLHFEFSLDDFLINQNIPGREEGWKGILNIFLQRYNQIEYRPIVILSYSFEKWITGEINPTISHFINLLLYWFITLAVYNTAIKFITKEEYKIVLILSILLFIVHPVHVEVLANLKSRDNLLSCLFTVLSVNFFLGHIYLQKRIWYILIGVLFFILAFLSKLDAAGLIFLFPAILLITKRVSIKKVLFSFIILLLIFLIIRSLLVDSFIPIDTSVVNKGTTFTENPLSQNFTFLNRLAAGALTFWYYIKMLVFPVGYRYYYGYDAVKLYPIYYWQSIVAGMAIIVLLSIIIRYFLREKTLLICLSGFIFFIVYALNFITPVAGIIADRYVFISSVFFCGFTGFFFYKIIKNERVYYIVCCIVILSLSILSFYRTSAWQDKLTLIERDAPHLQNSYEAMRIATSTYIEFSDKETINTNKETLLNKAVNCAENGNHIYPKNVLLHKLQATAYFKLNKLQDAKKSFQIAIANDSSEYESYILLGDIFYTERKLDSAYYYYWKAFNHDKKDATLINNISGILYEKGDKKGCIDFNEKMLAKNDSVYAAWENLGYFYLQERDTLKSVNYFEKGFKYGLQNPEIAGIIADYLRRNNQQNKAIFFKNYTK